MGSLINALNFIVQNLTHSTGSIKLNFITMVKLIFMCIIIILVLFYNSHSSGSSRCLALIALKITLAHAGCLTKTLLTLSISFAQCLSVNSRLGAKVAQ